MLNKAINPADSQECQKGDIDSALARVGELWDQGYAAVDIVTTIFRVTKTVEELPEYLKLEFIRVGPFLPTPSFRRGLTNT